MRFFLKVEYDKGLKPLVAVRWRFVLIDSKGTCPLVQIQKQAPSGRYLYTKIQSGFVTRGHVPLLLDSGRHHSSTPQNPEGMPYTSIGR